MHPALRLPGRDGPLTPADLSQLTRTPEGIPLMLRDVDGYLGQLGDELTLPLDALPYGAVSHLARYLPSVVQPDAPMRRAIAELVAAHAPPEAALAVDFGCSVGPDLRTLRRHAAHVIGLDSYATPLRVAAAQLSGQPVPVPVRLEGRRFEWAEAPIDLPAIDGVSLAVAHALDPPLAAETADIVLAANLLDNVADPVNLIGQLDAVLRPGGLLVLTSPFHWQDSLTPPDEQLGGGTIPALQQLGSEAALAALLTGLTPLLPLLAYDLLETRDVPWSIRDHARCEVTYLVHALAARKR